MKPPFQLDIPKRAQACAKGGEQLTPGMDYYSILVEDDALGLVRHDYCTACWEKGAKAEALANARSQWKSKVVFRKEDDAQMHLNRDEKILYLLREAMKEQTDEAMAETFVLALYLARRRLLYLRQELEEEGHTVQLYEVAATEEMLAIKKIALSHLQIEKIQQDVAKKLK